MNMLDLHEAASLLRVHPKTLEAKARKGEAPAVKIGKSWLFIEVDLIEWIRSQYRSSGETKCHSTKEATSIGVSGRSAAKELERLLAHPTKSKHKNTTTADVLNFGAHQS